MIWKQKKHFVKKSKEFIDKTIEEKVVEQAMYSGSIAQAIKEL